MKAIILTAIGVLATPAIANASTSSPNCHAIILAPIKDDMRNAWKKGQVVPVDIARNTPAGGAFCSHGGSCLPRKGNGREVVRLTDCKIGPSIGDGDRRLVAGPRRR